MFCSHSLQLWSGHLNQLGAVVAAQILIQVERIAHRSLNLCLSLQAGGRGKLSALTGRSGGLVNCFKLFRLTRGKIKTLPGPGQTE